MKAVATGRRRVSVPRPPCTDLIIIDDAEAGKSGLDLCRHIRASTSLPMILISPNSTTKDKVAGLRAGADDYIVRPFEAIEVLARVWSLLRRHSQLAHSELNMKNNALILDPER